MNAAVPAAPGGRSRWQRLILQWFMPLYLLGQFAYFMGYNLGVHILAPLPGLLLAAAAWRRQAGSPAFRAMLWFVLFCIASGVLFFLHDVPLLSYFLEIWKYVLPMAFFFIGADRDGEGTDYEKSFFWACGICFAITIFWYMTGPAWYTQRLLAIRDTNLNKIQITEFDILDLSRFAAIFQNCYGPGFLGICLLGLSFHLFDQARGKRETYLYGAGILLAWTTCILAQLRIAMALSTLTVGGHIAYGMLFTNRRRRYGVFAALLGGGFLAALVIGLSVHEPHVESLMERLTGRMDEMNIGEAMSTRTHQYSSALEDWNSVYFGYGVGSGSGAARKQGFVGVSDGNYIKILYEQGLVGLTWFALLVVATVVRGTRNFRQNRYELGIFLYYIAAAIGSNAFCIDAIYAMPFWYCAGRIWNSAETRRRLEEAEKAPEGEAA